MGLCCDQNASEDDDCVEDGSVIHDMDNASAENAKFFVLRKPSNKPNEELN